MKPRTRTDPGVLIDEWHDRLCSYHWHERQEIRRAKRARMRRIHSAYSRRRR